jgi:hypothetical protein
MSLDNRALEHDQMLGREDPGPAVVVSLSGPVVGVETDDLAARPVEPRRRPRAHDRVQLAGREQLAEGAAGRGDLDAAGQSVRARRRLAGIRDAHGPNGT